MQYGKISYLNKKASRIFYGVAIEPFLSGGDGNELLDAVFALGINTFDLARVYGEAETAMGRWMEERGNREDVILLSKCAHPSATWEKRVNEKEIRYDFAVSSEKLRTDYIDIYLLHRDDPEVEVGEIVEILNAMHAEGKIGAFGGSNWMHERIALANEYAYKHNLIPFTVSSPSFSLAEQVRDPWGGGGMTISGPSNQEARDWYRKNNMPVIAYSSLAHGMLSGKVKSQDMQKNIEDLDEVIRKGYLCEENIERLRRCEELANRKGCSVPQLALAWIFKQNLDTFAVVSSSNPKRMQSNIDALQLELSQEELAYLNLQKEEF